MTRATSRRTHRTRAVGRLAALALLAVTVVACSSGENDVASGDSSAREPAAGVPEMAGEGGSVARSALGSGADDAAVDAVENGADDRALISQGNVQLRADDVGEARFEVQKIVDRLAGEVAEEQTGTDDDGDVKRSRLVLRIPSADFATAMTELEGAAELISSSSTVDDVTTEVIDNGVRLEVQRRSIRRIALLLDRAQSIRDIVAIEGQLSRRQAVLGSLQRQQAYLADQTSMATITVSLERTKAKAAAEPAEDDTGFVAGLANGWDAFKTVTVGLATALGALLPFLVALALLGLLARLLTPVVLRAGRTARTPSTAPAGQDPSTG